MTPSQLLILIIGASDASRRRRLVPCDGDRSKRCCGDGICNGPEDAITCMADCPGVTTDDTCGEEPHSDRGGRGLTFGVSHRAASPQDCCDKCKKHSKGCNSGTFCGYPVCWGLDTGISRAREPSARNICACRARSRLAAGWLSVTTF